MLGLWASGVLGLGARAWGTTAWLRGRRAEGEAWILEAQGRAAVEGLWLVASLGLNVWSSPRSQCVCLKVPA